MGCTWDFGHAVNGPIHKVPGPTLRACRTQDSKHLTNADLLWLFPYFLVRTNSMRWRVATRHGGTEQPLHNAFGPCIPSFSGARALQRRVGPPLFILRRELINNFFGNSWPASGSHDPSTLVARYSQSQADKPFGLSSGCNSCTLTSQRLRT